jgi:hypothetical protein
MMLYYYHAAYVKLRYDSSGLIASKVTSRKTVLTLFRLNPGRPVSIPMIVGGRSMGGTLTLLEHLDAIGLPVMYLDPAARSDHGEKLMPDMAGKSQEEIDLMPPFARYFKCAGQTEKGDPNCGHDKFNNKICDKRKFRTSWHPGWVRTFGCM